MTISNSPVAVFCGANLGKDPEYQNAARSLGQELARQGRTLIYGGGNRGVMGVVSATVLENGGRVCGVLPQSMANRHGQSQEGSGVVKKPLDTGDRWEEIIVDSMHERKTKMAGMAVGGFIALPGGFGTFEEVLEVVTWSQLGIHQKPVVVCNVCGFFNPLKGLIETSVAAGFIQERNRSLVTFVDCPPPDSNDAKVFDWGKAATRALDDWRMEGAPLFDWPARAGLSQIESNT